MPNSVYHVARRVARELAGELLLTPPFDLDAVVERFARIERAATTDFGHCDVVALHAAVPGDHPRIVVQASLDAVPDRRRFALAHALGHVLLGWHPLGAPCDVSVRPLELPVSAHDLLEGEANAFARELLAPRAWIESFGALDRPAELIRHVAERAGIPIMAAARAVATLLEPNVVWAVVDAWDGVLDAGRSSHTSIRPPQVGATVDAERHSQLATERHRADLERCSLLVWRFDPDEDALPRDRSARELARTIATDIGATDAGDGLVATIDGVAGWANEQLGVASLDGMSRVLNERVRSLPALADVATHPRYDDLIAAKATELVTRRLAR